MRNILAHINLLFALIFLISAGSAFGQSSTSTTPKTNTKLDSYIAEETEKYGVDLGLKVYWADRNVGNNSTNVSDFFAWGDVSTTKSNHIRTNSAYYDFWSGKYTKYNKSDGKTKLELVDDIANSNWNGFWRMPTKAEYENLLTNTTFSGSTSQFVFTGINGNNNSITLPCNGYWGVQHYSSFHMGSRKDGYGLYWSSSLDESEKTHAYSLRLYKDRSNFKTGIESDYRYYGYYIRPVIDKCKNVVINAQYPGNTNESTVASSQSYPKGSTLHAETVECYHYQWYKNGSPVAGGYNNDIEVTESNATYKVVYFKKVHEITTQTNPDNGEYGSATIVNSTANNKYESCSTITLKAIPKGSCYYFDKWIESKNGATKEISPSNNQGYTCSTTGGVNSLEVTVDTTATYTAYFIENKVDVTIISEDSNKGTVAFDDNN